jgi:hypothetical protein
MYHYAVDLTLWLCFSFHLGLNICYIIFTVVLLQSLPVVVMHKGQHAIEMVAVSVVIPRS